MTGNLENDDSQDVQVAVEAVPPAGPGRSRRPIEVLRDRVGDRSPEQKDYYKDQTQVRKQLTEALKQGARTIPELSRQCGLPSEKVVWHIMAMRRYGKVVEGEIRGDYYSYRLKEV